MALNDVGMFSILVRHHYGNYCSTIVSYSNFIALTVLEYIKISLLTADSSLKVTSFQTTDVFCLCSVIHNSCF